MGTEDRKPEEDESRDERRNEKEDNEKADKKIIEGIEKVDLSADLDVSKVFEDKNAETATKDAGEVKGEGNGDKEKDTKTNKYFYLIVIALLIGAAGVFAYNRYYEPSSDNDTVTYNNFPFVKIDTHWTTQWSDGQDVYNLKLRFNPYEAESIPIFGELEDDFNLRTAYVTFDPDKEPNSYGYEALAAAELSLNLAGVFGSDLISACTQNVTGVCSERPTITCDNTNGSVLYLQRSEGDAKVLLEGNCITISGSEFELVKAVDKLLYKIYKIIE